MNGSLSKLTDELDVKFTDAILNIDSDKASADIYKIESGYLVMFFLAGEFREEKLTTNDLSKVIIYVASEIAKEIEV